MLEKQKEWCHDKMEKGKKWFNDHKVAISVTAGYVAGIALTIGSAVLAEKIFKPECNAFQVFYLDPEDPGDFAVGKVGKDRFGKEHVMNVTILRAEDRDLLVKNIDEAIAETKALREKT